VKKHGKKQKVFFPGMILKDIIYIEQIELSDLAGGKGQKQKMNMIN